MPSSASCERGSLPSRSAPARDWRLRIEDILAAVERVQRYTAGMDLASFLADEKTVDAVSFCFGVSGEAAPTFQDRAGFRDRAGSCTGIRSAMTSRAGAIRVVLAGSPHPLKRPSAMAVHGAAPVATNCCAASPPWSRHGATTTASVARRLARA